MSGAAAEKKGIGRRLLDVVALAVVFGILYGSARFVPHFQGGLATLGAVGFLLVAGTIVSDLAEIVGMPHLTGYLIAGIVAGPYILHLIDHETVKGLGKVDTLALALIALEGGAQLKFGMLKDGLKSLVWATLVQSAMGLVLMSIVFMAAQPLIPFTRGLTTSGLLGVSLLWGMLAITRSPSACLGILSQTRAEGPLARFALTFIMTSDVLVVVLLAGIMTIARPLIIPDSTFSLAVFHDLGKEILGSVALGTTLGLVLTIYMRLVGKQLLVVFVALGFGLTEALHYLNFEPLLTFLVAGMVVQNLSKQGPKFLHAIEQTGGVVYIIFFASAGAHLDLPLLAKLWPVALIFCGARALITWGSHRIGSRLAHDPPVLARWGFSSLISQAGIALGIASLIVREFPMFGAGFSALAIATVAINELAGPILFKLALDKNGESRNNVSATHTVEAAVGSGPA